MCGGMLNPGIEEAMERGHSDIQVSAKCWFRDTVTDVQ
jgi:hypothetical protein